MGDCVGATAGLAVLDWSQWRRDIKKLLFLWEDDETAIKQTAKEMFVICLHAKAHISSSSAELFIMS